MRPRQTATDDDLKTSETAESGKTLSQPRDTQPVSSPPSTLTYLQQSQSQSQSQRAQGSRSMEMSHLHLACLRAPICICTEGVPVACTHWCASLGWRRDGGVHLVYPSILSLGGGDGGGGGGGAIIMVSWARRSWGSGIGTGLLSGMYCTVWTNDGGWRKPSVNAQHRWRGVDTIVERGAS
ncbi:hypothetical protein V500_04220 [Pseudogymnoascus sp. VKM F-4518 (FW-2643)]|nr:hypothetical protein V500_04220 [Pseudogymnoascus sp. VKM F-4518 (FW-2643)]